MVAFPELGRAWLSLTALLTLAAAERILLGRASGEGIHSPGLSECRCRELGVPSPSYLHRVMQGWLLSSHWEGSFWPEFYPVRENWHGKYLALQLVTLPRVKEECIGHVGTCMKVFESKSHSALLKSVM